MPKAYEALAAKRDTTLPSTDLAELIAGRSRRETAAGTTDALLAEGRAGRE